MVCVGCKRTAKLLLPESSLGNNSAPSMAPCRVVPPPPKVRDAPAVKMRLAGPILQSTPAPTMPGAFWRHPIIGLGRRSYMTLCLPFSHFPSFEGTILNPKPLQCTKAPMIMVRSAISLDLPKSI